MVGSAKIGMKFCKLSRSPVRGHHHCSTRTRHLVSFDQSENPRIISLRLPFGSSSSLSSVSNRSGVRCRSERLKVLTIPAGTFSYAAIVPANFLEVRSCAWPVQVSETIKATGDELHDSRLVGLGGGGRGVVYGHDSVRQQDGPFP